MIDKTEHTYTLTGKGQRVNKIVYWYIVKIESLSDLKIKDLKIPKKDLQVEEVDWAGFIPYSEAMKRVMKSQINVINNLRGSGLIESYNSLGDTYNKSEQTMKHVKLFEEFILDEETRVILGVLKEDFAKDYAVAMKKARSGDNRILAQMFLSSAEYQKAKKLKGFDAKDWKWDSKKDLYRYQDTDEASLPASSAYDEQLDEAAYIPDNIKKFAKQRDALPLVKAVAKWAEKAGKSISGGTAIGKNYDTLVLDLEYQGSEVRIDLYTGIVTLYKTKVTDAKSFKSVLDSIKESVNVADQSIAEAYKLGAKWSKDFDYDGMLAAGTKAKVSMGVKKLQKLLDSFTDVNYHKDGQFLGLAIEQLEDGDTEAAEDYIEEFIKVCKKTLG